MFKHHIFAYLIDLNRNYPYVWRYVPNSCTGQSHPGPYAMSEPEIKANADYMATFKDNLRLYLSVHTYGDYVLFPFGFDFDVWVNNWREHILVGQKFVDAIYAASGNTKYYELGNSADLLYTANGASGKCDFRYNCICHKPNLY